MMNLNKNNGNFGFGEYLIKPLCQIQDLKNEFANENLELWIENNEWITYRLEFREKFILLISFFNDNLKTIEIYLTCQPGKNVRNRLQDLLGCIGGENKYSWGNVELNEDIKAGYASIVIKFI